jgi:Fe-S-cluster containining protein
MSFSTPESTRPPAPEGATPAPWYADGLSFACTQCGRCCGGGPGNVWVSRAEVAAIAEYLGMSPEDFKNRHTRKCGWRRSLREQRNYDCEFLKPDGTGRKVCTIYPVRPVQCRTWPFWKSNLASPSDWADAGQNCPGINKGPRHPLPVIQTALTENGTLPL